MGWHSTCILLSVISSGNIFSSEDDRNDNIVKGDTIKEWDNWKNVNKSRRIKKYFFGLKHLNFWVFIHSLYEYLLVAYYVLGTVWNSGIYGY